MNILVGYSGFVGSNLCAKGNFQAVFNSKNIQEAYGIKPDLLIYAGVRGEKYLANQNPEEDRKHISQAKDNISKIKPKKLVLISTIDVFKNPVEVDENTEIDATDLQAYGKNRYDLECWVQKYFQNPLIVRLPGLFGNNIKKNFIYDIINVIPFMLKEEKFKELIMLDNELEKFYELQSNGFYKCNELDLPKKRQLKKKFYKLNFTAMNFTDSRSTYQFYPLERLWNDIQIALAENLQLVHLATEPVSAEEIFNYFTGKTFINYLEGKPASYDCRTLFAELFSAKKNYLLDKNRILEMISLFIKNALKELPV